MELVDSVDELRTSSSIRGISMPNFEVLDARIASALNKIIHNSQSGGTKGPEAGQFPSRQTDCLLDLRLLSGYWNPTILSKTTPTYSLSVYEMMIFRNSIHSGTEYYCF